MRPAIYHLFLFLFCDNAVYIVLSWFDYDYLVALIRKIKVIIMTGHTDSLELQVQFCSHEINTRCISKTFYMISLSLWFKIERLRALFFSGWQTSGKPCFNPSTSKKKRRQRKKKAFQDSFIPLSEWASAKTQRLL